MNIEKNIFDLRLNDSGIAAVQKFNKMTRWIVVLIILQALVALAEAGMTISVFWLRHSTIKFPLRAQLFPLYTFCICVVAIIQVYYYRKSSMKLVSSIEHNDELEFNYAFTLLYRNSIFGVITLLIGFLWNSWEFSIYFNSSRQLL